MYQVAAILKTTGRHRYAVIIVVVVVKVSDVLNVMVWVIEPLTVKSQRANTLSFAMFVT